MSLSKNASLGLIVGWGRGVVHSVITSKWRQRNTKLLECYLTIRWCFQWYRIMPHNQA